MCPCAHAHVPPLCLAVDCLSVPCAALVCLTRCDHLLQGMGEPLDNVDAVIRAICIMTEPNGLNVPLSHITVSTSGEAQHVYTLLDALPSVRVAFSLHAANEELRSQLMPINRRVPLAELAAAMRHYLGVTRRRVTIQYVLLAGVNDTPTHAQELAIFLLSVGPIERLHVNLIPYNAQSGQPHYETPSQLACKQFKETLKESNLFVKIRETKGAEKMAACGQLGNVHLRRTLMTRRREAEYENSNADREKLSSIDKFRMIDVHAAPSHCARKELAW